MSIVRSDGALLANGELDKLQAKLHRYEPILEQSGRFRARDIDQSQLSENVGGVLEFLVHHNGIRIVDHVHDDGDRTKYCIYEWRKDVRDCLLEYSEGQDRLPCGHRVHIYNDPNVPTNKLGCRYCADSGKHIELSKERVRELL